MKDKYNKKELKVSALENGTVIDHIPQGVVLQVLRALHLENFDDAFYLGSNLDSKKMGKKGIIKVSNKYFEKEDINKIALIAPTATIIEIKEYEIIKKTKVELPKEVIGLVKCINPNCITNNEQITTKFEVLNDFDDIKFRCYYCEKTMKKENLEFL
ncbi:MAG: aspartate carbamoyltransferase regulatory subunit [Bacteroidales bacterium]|jgi:aspartate carbamoyltransferase regulatory subunit|nr:aspartate carbamoyltransferase regulatory subunit [Bacteroidales bacterium]MDI9576034.1 aspartate carbamoyltransferase regulatory subunit [Bacteroidota bacterium]MDD2593639.1 aspartate carbamoyltransferase regulatory subunit [Bacteroidales bacterium]MDD3756417.1 aspartate carbamoyltransferase regulatory subunit [Bacteroidales bacterium]MDY0401682.1 aspartate carbamoyltransferase regulatory subunit [Bacteroidales bacterium]